MAHFVYPTGWVSPLPAVWVPGPVEYELLWDQLFASVNGDAGGTWAPGAFITIGGSGLQLAGTGHELKASSGRLTVQAGAEIRVTDTAVSGVGQPKILVNGSNGAITLYVDNHTSILEAASGSIMALDHGAAFNAYGTITLISSGPGAFTAQTGTTSTWQGGSTLTAASGSTVELEGGSQTNMSGAVNVKDGSVVTMEAGSILACSGNPTVTGTITVTANVSLNGTTTIGGSASVACTSGAALTGTLASSATITQSGNLTLSGVTTFASSTVPMLAPNRSWTRRATSIAATTINTNVPACTPAFLPGSSINPCFALADGIASLFQQVILEFDPPPDGGTIETLTIKSKGSSVGSPLDTLPSYKVIRWRDFTTNPDDLMTTANDAHDGTALNWATTQTTTASITANGTVDRAYRYGVLVSFPVTAGSTVACYVDATITGTTDRITGK